MISKTLHWATEYYFVYIYTIYRIYCTLCPSFFGRVKVKTRVGDGELKRRGDARGFRTRGAVRTSKMKLATPIDLTVHGAAQRFPLYSFRNINYKYKYNFFFRKNKNYACCFYLDFNWICQARSIQGWEEYGEPVVLIIIYTKTEMNLSLPLPLHLLLCFISQNPIFPSSVHLGEDREWRTNEWASFEHGSFYFCFCSQRSPIDFGCF